ncbi:hypothetical protein P5673_012548 [Acropora cervicornis]|uniref:Uncharacterized protein n=1 Tax=Acropora cervicornis TaxID=6130 RepID=A0AAD9QN36_ACRCE|nr:hypothetical protein P5673_012548 [Acropora cervicornis]
MLGDQMFEIERKTYNTVIDDKEITLSFKFELLPNEMKYLAFLAGKEVQNLQQVCSNFFRATALFLSSTPTSWTIIGHVVPLHAKQLCDSIGMGLGVVNTMEDMGFGHRNCVVVGCPNNGKRLNKWAKQTCTLHACF